MFNSDDSYSVMNANFVNEAGELDTVSIDEKINNSTALLTLLGAVCPPPVPRSAYESILNHFGTERLRELCADERVMARLLASTRSACPGVLFDLLGLEFITEVIGSASTLTGILSGLDYDRANSLLQHLSDDQLCGKFERCYDFMLFVVSIRSFCGDSSVEAPAKTVEQLDRFSDDNLRSIIDRVDWFIHLLHELDVSNYDYLLGRLGDEHISAVMSDQDGEHMSNAERLVQDEDVLSAEQREVLNVKLDSLGLASPFVGTLVSP